MLLDPKINDKLHRKYSITTHTYLTIYWNKSYSTLFLGNIIELVERFIRNGITLDGCNLFIDDLDSIVDFFNLSINFHRFLVIFTLKSIYMLCHFSNSLAD